jgi:hypothetical protein
MQHIICFAILFSEFICAIIQMLKLLEVGLLVIALIFKICRIFWITRKTTSIAVLFLNYCNIHSVWHDIYVATETEGLIWAVVYYSVRLRKIDRERARDLRRDA